MEIITIHVLTDSIVVVDGQMKGSRLKWQAGTFYIYLLGSVPLRKRDSVQYQAMQAAISRHIPLKSLKSYGWV